MSTTPPQIVNNLIVISDPHFGSQLGLCPPDGASLDGGARYVPSSLQVKVWGYWDEFWGDWVPRVTRGEPYDVVINGDALDGRHHQSTTQMSENLADQAKLALAVLGPVKAGCRSLYMIRGTEAHVGPAAENEESLAVALGAVPNEFDQYSRFELWKRVGGPDGALCHILHHIGTTGRQAYESSAPQAELIAEFAEAGRNREEPPDFVIRAHRHRFIKVQNPSSRHEATAIVTPGWQLKTPFVWRLPGGRVSEPQFGGILIRKGDEEFYSRHAYWAIGRSRVEA